MSQIHSPPSLSPSEIPSNKTLRRWTHPITSREIATASKVLKQIERQEREMEEEKLENLFNSLKKPKGKQFSVENLILQVIQFI